MFCQQCGQELPRDAAFCPKCGSRTADDRVLYEMVFTRNAMKYEYTLYPSSLVFQTPKVFAIDRRVKSKEVVQLRTITKVTKKTGLLLNTIKLEATSPSRTIEILCSNRRFCDEMHQAIERTIAAL